MKNILVYEEIPHNQYFVTDYNEHGEEVETTLPEGVRVYTSISENDFREGQRNNYAVSM